MPFLPVDAQAAHPIPSMKSKPCPHCKKTGNLNGHGYLRGYGDGVDNRAVRGRRIYCSNRGHRGGCGRTHSYFLASVIPKSSVSATAIWCFLSLILAGFSRRAAHRKSLAANTSRRIWARCVKAQGTLRHNLCTLAQPPPTVFVVPFLQVIRHLVDAFPLASNPIAAYQSAFQSAFL